MRKAGIFFFGAMMAVGSLLGAGCGGDSGGTGGSGGSGGGDTASSSSGSTTPTTSSSDSSSSASSSSGGGATATCDTYCTDIMKNCAGDTAQYPDEASCKAACATFPPGKTGDTADNSLACRAYHANAAAAADMAATHCPHAGPTGGDKDVSDDKGAVCGDGCAAFCEVALAACGTAKTYKDAATCLADCRTFKAPSGDYSAKTYSDMANWTDDFGCRMYHLTVAAISAENATKHCAHITGTSTTCTK